MKVEWLISGSAPVWVEQNYQDGGYVYDTHARNIIKDLHDVQVLYLSRGKSRSRLRRIAQLAGYILKAGNTSFKGEVVVRDMYSTAFAPFDRDRKHLVIFHHLDTSGFDNRIFNGYFTRKFYKKIALADTVIVVSEYWKNLLQEAGCSNVVVIYNSFDLAMFDFSREELVSFRQRHGLMDDKPLVYLGNARPGKGYLESYHALRDLDVTFVATGKGGTDLPIHQLYLPYRDYLRLLKASTLVLTMSQFNEGWCRTAHEAMLCGTPVVGSGKGGMRELLDKGGQLICDDFEKLGPLVADLLNDRQKLADMAVSGREYAGQFTLDYFRKSWVDLFSSLETSVPDTRRGPGNAGTGGDRRHGR
ncbi:MAG: glycosyltransferase family 4 protein [Pseudomonadota bacterium]